MPLKKGKSQKTVSANIRTLVDDYSKSGRIGTSKPANKKAAVKQAVAIALRQAGKPKKFAEGGLSTMTPGYEESMYAGSVAGMTEQEQAAAAKKKAGSSSSSSSSSSGGSSQQQQRRTPTYLPLQSQAGQVEDQMPKYKQTRMRMRFLPEYIDVTKSPVNMRRGGKVSSKKGRNK